MIFWRWPWWITFHSSSFKFAEVIAGYTNSFALTELTLTIGTFFGGGK
jgi:hypothetical protein